MFASYDYELSDLERKRRRDEKLLSKLSDSERKRYLRYLTFWEDIEEKREKHVKMQEQFDRRKLRQARKSQREKQLQKMERKLPKVHVESNTDFLKNVFKSKYYREQAASPNTAEQHKTANKKPLTKKGVLLNETIEEVDELAKTPFESAKRERRFTSIAGDDTNQTFTKPRHKIDNFNKVFAKISMPEMRSLELDLNDDDHLNVLQTQMRCKRPDIERSAAFIRSQSMYHQANIHLAQCLRRKKNHQGGARHETEFHVPPDTFMMLDHHHQNHISAGEHKANIERRLIDSRILHQTNDSSFQANKVYFLKPIDSSNQIEADCGNADDGKDGVDESEHDSEENGQQFNDLPKIHPTLVMNKSLSHFPVANDMLIFAEDLEKLYPTIETKQAKMWKNYLLQSN